LTITFNQLIQHTVNNSFKVYLDKIKILSTHIVIDEFSDKLVYHNIKHIKRIAEQAEKIGTVEGLTEEEIDTVKIAVWLGSLGYRDYKKFKKSDDNDPFEFFNHCLQCTLGIAKELLDKVEMPEQKQQVILKMIPKSSMLYDGDFSKMDRVFADAMAVDFSREKGGKALRRLYEQLLLINVYKSGKSKWYDEVLKIANAHQYHTAYGQTKLQPKKEALILQLEKEYKSVKKQGDRALKRELDVTDEELKDLKKKLKASRGRDDRGIQTMLRTTSKNHYTLNEMVDRKASIMISVNSIILSVIISGLLAGTQYDTLVGALPVAIMLFTSIFSIVFAILSIQPDSTHGKFTKEEIKNKQGNLLFFGNYHDMDYADYEWGIFEMLSDQDYLYSTMIRDIYYLGKTLNKKYRNIRLSLGIFMFGFIAAVVAFVIIRFTTMM